MTLLRGINRHFASLIMLKFNNEESQKLDEEIIAIFSGMLECQKSSQQKLNKQQFLVRERKILYDLFRRVNEERRVRVCKK